MPDDLRSQLQPLLDCVEAMGLPLLRIDGVEADDVIGTLAKQAAAQDIDVLISTGDKDMAQLVERAHHAGEHDDRLAPRSRRREDQVRRVARADRRLPRAGRRQHRQHSGRRQSRAEDRGEVAQRVRHARQAGRERRGDRRQGRREPARRPARLWSCRASSRRSTRTSSSTATWNRSCAASRTSERLRELYTRLEFRALLRQLDGGAAAGSAPATAPPAVESAAAAARAAARTTRSILTMADLQRWIARLQAAELIALHVETASLDYMEAEIVGLAFSIEPGSAAYVPLAHDYAGAPEQLVARRRCCRLCSRCSKTSSSPKIGHHLKYGEHVLKRKGIELRGMRFDSMLESYVWNSTATRHELDAVVAALSRLRPDPLRRPDRPRREADSPSARSRSTTATKYAAENADVVAAAASRAVDEHLRACRRCNRCTKQIEQPLVPVLFRMEQAGVLIDGELLRQQSLRAGAAHARDRSAGARGGGRPVLARFAEAAAGSAVRQARAAGAAQDADRASRRRPKTCWKSSRKNTSCRG